MVKKIDCLGDFCPIPAIKTKLAYKDLEINEKLIIITDHSCAPSNIKDTLANEKCNIYINEIIKGIWEITIEKIG
ncbi:TusA-related sulfurtransferase [Keratinibaculum paraultunense]|uniref:TusA-related sulfurtransferase n=1 Tax=Keratinibaculum paraultunense TaxID=1278232 RepID=A0A4R3KRG5_9FIRM|nr:sulfurtransferase TusA family protein [Keratinibaculum paraultunense]QQY79559.1 sulfurtransferase TusA family protein [Keratinibaculum paraultunense]TCS87584.1 TusA-related sulfurtransferase [Keratinibaculum paraultunense]